MNQQLFNAIHDLSGRWPALDALTIFFARDAIFILFGGLLLWLWWRQGRAGVLIYAKILMSAGLAWLLSTALKALIISPRPFAALNLAPLIAEDNGHSFPSGHTALAFGLAFGVLFFASRKKMTKPQFIILNSCFLILALLVGLARIYAGVHWPLDILGGIGAGLLAALLIQLTNRKFFLRP